LEQAVRLCGDGAARPEVTPAIPLALSRLSLVNFRSYARAELCPGSGPVVLAGPNGTGKTNCLEAISFLSPGKGLRSAKLSDVQRKGPVEALSAWGVAATLIREGEAFEIGTDITPAPAGATTRRLMRLNGASAPAAEFAELAPMLWLSPAQDRLFLEGASERRRFLDRLVFGLDAGHARRAARYERATRERLKLLREGYADPVWLDSLEETMAESGAAITEARLRIVELLNAELMTRAKESRFPAAHLALAGAEDGGDREALATRFKRTRRLDGESGRTNVGPHLADLLVRHTGKHADARDCSTGEQKALLISILLANAWLQKRRNQGVSPFLLLDEVAAHLDAERREALFAEILELAAQAWMTGTDRELFAPLAGAASIFTVADGQFVPQDQT
jgi:DNA replication and repair protein RecF